MLFFLRTCLLLFLIVLTLKQIEEEYIYELLEGSDISDPYTAQGVLKDLPSNAIKMKVCDRRKRH